MASSQSRGLVIVGWFKLLEVVALICLALGAFHYLHKDFARSLETWIRAARIDPENKYLARLLSKVHLVTHKRLKELGFLTLVYAGLYLAEGVGLILRKRWAEYLTIIATASFVPLEVYEILHKPNAPKVIVLILNVAILVYLIVEILRVPRAAAIRKR